MGQTTNYNLPYPELTDPANVPADMRLLAEAVESTIENIQTESGSNENVKYIKYSDGTLIQYGRVTLQSYDRRSSGGLTYWSNDTYIELPVNFIDTNYIVSTNVGLANMNILCQSYGVVDSVNKIRISFISTVDADRRNVDFICIGRWK